jgi:hypothetical protein
MALNIKIRQVRQQFEVMLLFLQRRNGRGVERPPGHIEGVGPDQRQVRVYLFQVGNFDIADAQKDLSKIDVLVCGGCHEVFHFVEEFQKHKSTDQCSNISVLTCENEEKSQIWGFTLWKTKQVQTHKDKEEEPPTSWDIYQKWTKLDQIEKDLWISAGKTLQFVNKIAAGKITENDEKKIEKDPLALDDPIPNVLQK